MLIALNKPFGVLTQFTDDGGRATLADFVPSRRVSLRATRSGQ